MTSADFSLAQDRLVSRRRIRGAAADARHAQQRASHASTALDRLPYPLSRIGRAGTDAWHSIKGREGTRPAFRVGQVDAELLDEELLELLKGQVGEALKYFGQNLKDDWSAEILLVLRAALFKLSIWDHDTTYGAALQNLKYIDARHQGPVHRPPTLIQKTLYGFTTVFGRYAWSKYSDWLLYHSSEYDDDDDPSQPPNNIRLLSQLTSVLSTTYSIAAFASFLTFLLNGQYRTLLDRILRLRLTPPTSQLSREVSFEYLNRQLVWHAFTEFLLFILPLVGIARWRRWISRAWRKVKATFRGEQTDDKAGECGELGFLPERTCAICYQDQNPTGATETEILAVSGGGGVVGSAQTDVTNPYECVPCGCVYCFVCLAQRLEAEEGEGWVCLRCGALVKECKPWDGDVLVEEEGKSGVGKSVGFVEEGKEKLRVVEPRPEEDIGGSKIRALDGSSTEWADVRREDETETDVHESTEDDASALSSSEDEAEEEEAEAEGKI